MPGADEPLAGRRRARRADDPAQVAPRAARRRRPRRATGLVGEPLERRVAPTRSGMPAHRGPAERVRAAASERPRAAGRVTSIRRRRLAPRAPGGGPRRSAGPTVTVVSDGEQPQADRLRVRRRRGRRGRCATQRRSRAARCARRCRRRSVMPEALGARLGVGDDRAADQAVQRERRAASCRRRRRRTRGRAPPKIAASATRSQRRVEERAPRAAAAGQRAPSCRRACR